MCREITARNQTPEAHIQDFSHRNMNYMISTSNQTESHPPFSSARSFSSSRARTARHRYASGGQLMALLPNSPSPICSHDTSPIATQTSSLSSEIYYSDIASEFPPSRNQSFGTSCNENNCSTCFCEIDDWLEHANKFCKPSNFQTNNLAETDNLEDKWSMSSICKTFLAAPDHELYSITLPSVREESPIYEGQSRLACINSIYGASKSGGVEDGRRKLLGRPKPYNAFLNEIEMLKLEAERDAWKKAKHFKLMDRMRRKEAAIDEWELQQTRIAMEKMKKLQNKLEIEQLQVSAKTEKKLSSLKQKAEKQKKILRRKTIEKISAASNISETQTCRDFLCLKLGSFC